MAQPEPMTYATSASGVTTEQDKTAGVGSKRKRDGPMFANAWILNPGKPLDSAKTYCMKAEMIEAFSYDEPDDDDGINCVLFGGHGTSAGIGGLRNCVELEEHESEEDVVVSIMYNEELQSDHCDGDYNQAYDLLRQKNWYELDCEMYGPVLIFAYRVDEQFKQTPVNFRIVHSNKRV